MSSIEEYFDILDKQAQKNSQVIAKSLVKYLKATKESGTNKYESLKNVSQAQKVQGKNDNNQNVNAERTCSAFLYYLKSLIPVNIFIFGK